MILDNNIPRELLEVEKRLQENVDVTDSFIKRHRKVFEEFQHLADERNACIEEGKKLAKTHGCSTDLFKANESTRVVYDPDSFRDVFGPKKLAQACQVSATKVRAMVESGVLDKDKLDEVESENKVTNRVTPKYKPWDLG
jgi:CII-binding regulator of phage lambda lysogenization HflD